MSQAALPDANHSHHFTDFFSAINWHQLFCEFRFNNSNQHKRGQQHCHQEHAEHGICIYLSVCLASSRCRLTTAGVDAVGNGITHAKQMLSALTLLAGRQEGHPACKKTEWWGAGVVICLERGADLHTAQMMPLPLTVSCFSKIQIAFKFLVPANPGSPGERAVKWV